MKRVLTFLAPLTLISGAVLLSSSAFAAKNTGSSAAATVSPQERARIEEVVHQYLLQKPEVIVEALQLMQRKQYEQAEQTVKQTQQNVAQFVDPLFHSPNDAVPGNPNGKITVAEFFDYQCPHCVDMAPVVDAVIKANPEVRFVFKDFPIRGPMSEVAARAALAANKQGKYVEFQHAIFASNKPLTQDVIIEIAKNVGLDTDKLKKDMQDSSVDASLKANAKLAQDLKLFGTPAFFIGKTDAKSSNQISYFPGQMNQAQLQGTIDKMK